MVRRRSKAKKSITKNPTTERSATGNNPEPAAPVPSRKRLWLFRLTAVVFIPVLILFLLEIGIRLTGYGYQTGFYIHPADSDLFITNNKFGYRFFPKGLNRDPALSFISKKQAGTIRIFILGGSAAQGDLLVNFSFGRILEIMLRDRFPERKFEVVNAALTAINSHVVREIARDCAEHQPDLFLVYMGNNEVVGPFGPGTVFGNWTPKLPVIRANMLVKSTRTGQLLGNAIQSLFPSSKTPEKWAGLKMFTDKPVAIDDPRLATVYGNFRSNLVDICNIGQQAGAAVILSTVAVNLKDSPPFSSKHRAAISNTESQRWETMYQAGIKLEDEKKWSEALAKYALASGIDDRFAELHFRIGRCFMAEKKFQDARKHFSEARDLDILRFRADTEINRIIREVAEERKADGVYGLDAEKMFASGNSIPGEEWFYDHVHYKFIGNYTIARAFLQRIETVLPQLAASRTSASYLSDQQCAEALAFTPWDTYNIAEQLAEFISQPPFSEQLDHAHRLAQLQERANSLRRIVETPETLLDARNTYVAALERSPEDWILHYRFVRLLAKRGETDLAAEHLHTVQGIFPWIPGLSEELGNIELQNGNYSKAIDQYRKVLAVEPGNANAHVMLGSALNLQGQKAESIACYRKALKIDPNHVRARVNLGIRLTEQGAIQDAIDQFHKALEINPNELIGNHSLGYALSKQGRTEEAIACYQKVLEIDPHNEKSRINLGIELAGLGRVEEAIGHFKKAIEYYPENASAWEILAKILNRQGKIEEAVTCFRKASEIEPMNKEVRFQLGIALERQGHLEEAIDNFEQALKIDPGFSAARQALRSLDRQDN